MKFLILSAFFALAVMPQAALADAPKFINQSNEDVILKYKDDGKVKGSIEDFIDEGIDDEEDLPVKACYEGKFKDACELFKDAVKKFNKKSSLKDFDAICKENSDDSLKIEAKNKSYRKLSMIVPACK